MKTVILIFIIISVLLISPSFKNPNSTGASGNNCEVANFYKAIVPESGTKVLTSSENLEKAELILVPALFEEGTFNIEISRKGSNIYKLEGTNYYIETRYCYEYATYEDVILKVESNYGFTKGTLYFD